MSQSARGGLRTSLEIAGRAAFLAALASVVGCSAGNEQSSFEDDAPPTGSIAQELYLYANASLWPNGSVPICLNGHDGTLEAQYLKEILKDTWSAVARIDFTYTDVCASGGGYVRFNWSVVTTIGGLGGNSQVGFNSTAPTVTNISYCPGCDQFEASEAFKSLAAHEMGHALGFQHEHERDDANDCTQYGAFPGGVELSPYDSRSIMNYCRTPTRYETGYHAAERLSALDQFGVGVVYGKRVPYWMLGYVP